MAGPTPEHRRTTGSGLRFNLSIRRVAGNVWLMWRRTYGHTYDVWNAGSIELAPNPVGSP